MGAAMKKKLMRVVGRNSTNAPVMGGLFAMHDTIGFSLADSILVCRKWGGTPSIVSFVADAIKAGWPAERAIKVTMSNLIDAGDFVGGGIASKKLMLCVLDTTARHWEKYTTEALAAKFELEEGPK